MQQLTALKFWRDGDRPWHASMLASTVLHVCVLFLLACFWSIPPQALDQMGINTLWRDSVEVDQDLTILSVVSPTNKAESSTSAAQVSSSVSTITSLPDSNTLMPTSPTTATAWFSESFTAADLTEHVGGLSAPAGSSIAGDATTNGDSSGAGDGGGFFGLQAAGRRFVYVIDCSLSMNHPHASEAKTRFKRLKLELVKSIASMNSEQEFFIIFFNDRAIPMPSTTPQPATLSAQQRYLYWMQSVKADGLSDPTEAMRIALQMRPDVIYFLSDGAFHAKVEKELRSRRQDHTAIHTFAFAEELTPELKQGKEWIKAQQFAQARRELNRQELRIATKLARADLLLKDIAELNRGEFHLIP